MYENKTIIDINGYVIEKCVLFKDGKIQFFELQEGQQVVEYIDKSQIINGRNVGYLKPQWTGTEWIETATQEELNEAYPIVEILKTEIEILQETVDALVLASLGV